MSDRTKILERVGALLAKAEATEFGHERDAFRAKADELMLRYAIEHSEIIRREGRSLKDEVVKRTLDVGDEDVWITEHLGKLLRYIARHARCEDIGHPAYRSPYGSTEPPYIYRMSVVGMEADVDYVEMLFTSLRLQIANTLEPVYDHAKSIEDNVYVMRNAGLKWGRIEEQCGLAPFGPAQRAYEQACEERGEVPRKRVNGKMVQRNFVKGFVDEIWARFRDMKREQKEEDDGNRAALVPLTNAVNERFKEMFPDVQMMKGKADTGKFDRASYQRGQAAGTRADLGQTRIAQRPSLEG